MLVKYITIIMKKFIEFKGFNKIDFTINGETKTIDLAYIIKLYSFLKENINFRSNILSYLVYYDNYINRIDEVLDNSYDEETKMYIIGEDFSIFLNNDNHIAFKNVLENYLKKYKKHTLEYDIEYSYTNIYTYDRNEAKRFLTFVYEKYIKSFLEEYKDFKDFKKIYDSDLKIQYEFNSPI